MVRVFYKTLDISENLRSSLEDLSSKIFEFSEFMIDILKIDTLGGSFPHKVTYHDSCHLNRELGVYKQPRKLIQSIKGIEFQEMEQSDLCCGFGGTFSYKVKDVSLAMVARKCHFIEESGAEYCIGADSSCLMNIEGYLKKHNMQVKTMHIADLLARSINLL